MFDVNRKTVWKWTKRAYHPGRTNYHDQSRKPHRIHRKITPTIEDAITLLRDELNWGTHRIRVALQSPPPYIRHLLETTLGGEWRSILLSRQSINTVLKKHRRNGSPYTKNKKDWKFFRASRPNELWQIDIKGPFLLDGERWNALLILERLLPLPALHPLSEKGHHRSSHPRDEPLHFCTRNTRENPYR